MSFSVTFDPSVGGDGSSFNDGAGVGGMAEGQHELYFFPLLQQMLAVAAFLVQKAAAAADAANTALNAPGTQATTTTTVTIGTGSKSVTLQQTGKAFVQTLPVRIASAANAANFIEGPITSFAGTAMTINAVTTGGSGSFSDGVITPAVGGGVPGSRSITGAGLATGGGDLTANRVITVPAASVAEIRAGTVTNKVATPGDELAAEAEVALQFGANITTVGDAVLDMSKFINARVILAGDTVLPNPTGLVPGMKGRIAFQQDGTGNRKLSGWGSFWRGPGGKPILSTTPGAVDYADYDVVSATEIRLHLDRGPSN